MTMMVAVHDVALAWCLVFAATGAVLLSLSLTDNALIDSITDHRIRSWRNTITIGVAMTLVGVIGIASLGWPV